MVFFNGLGHMGMYIGGGQFIHAPHTGDVVKISTLAGYGSFVGARRIL
jgi:cell wall-associated NlpC family hydrolase